MKLSISYRSGVLGPNQIECLKRKGCGLINCRSKLKWGGSVRDEIRNIIDARTSCRGFIRRERSEE